MLLERAFTAIDLRRDEIIELARQIEGTPELGFFEYQTARVVREHFERLGIPYQYELARTGVKGRLSGRNSRATLAIIGEMDALILPEHPNANQDGVAHACGHHVQVAAMVACAYGLHEVMKELDGAVVLFAVPAEECIDLPRRLELQASGQLRCLVGKAELICRGAFDDVDLAVVTHTANGTKQTELASVGATLTGAVIKRAAFSGRSSHAGAAPEKGINALKAATVACSALDALRAGFADGQGIRINESVTIPNASLSTIPARAVIDAIVRARTLDALRTACRAFDRAMKAGSIALDAELALTTEVAYFPQEVDEGLRTVARDAFARVLGSENVTDAPLHLGASSDLGDVGLLMPVVQPRIAGVTGDPHTADYRIDDYDLAVLGSAKAMVAMAIDLLSDGARKAREVIEAHAATRLSRDEYVALRSEYEAPMVQTGTQHY
jgi:amidohydrolase